MPTSLDTVSRDLEIRLPRLHHGQLTVLDQARRFNWLDAGRRWRKTTLDLHLITKAAAHGGTYIWGGPTYRQVRVGWDEMRRACRSVVTFNESRMDALFPGGGRVHFVSLDEPDNARGLTADGIVFDEASEASERAWSEILRPMLMDTGGWAWFTFTPKGRNWTWRETMNALHGGDPESAAWCIPSLGCEITDDGRLARKPHALENPHIPFSELEHMYESMPLRTFQQEILAEFLDDAGGVFRGVEACVSGDPLDKPPDRVNRYVIGVDLAKHNDYTVLCVGDRIAHRVVAFDRFNKADWTLQKQRIIAAAKHWNDAMIWMDATGLGDPIYDDLRAVGLRIHPYKFTPASKEQLINHAVLMVEQKQVSYPRIPVLLDELKALQYFRTPSGTLRISAPEGMHDDAAIGFALMCWPMNHGSSGQMSQSIMRQLESQHREPLTKLGGLTIKERRF